MSDGYIPDAFKNKRVVATFVDGPSQGDTIRLDKDIRLVQVLDKTDPKKRHNYLRMTETELYFNGTQRPKEQND